MTNEDTEKNESFFIILTIEGTNLKHIEFRVDNPQRPLIEQVNAIVQRYQLPSVDGDGIPIQYFWGQIVENDGKIEILNFENEDGREMVFEDYGIQSGSHLQLLPVLIAEGCDHHSQQHGGYSKNELIISHNATGRNSNDSSIFDRSQARPVPRHLMPEQTSFVKRLFRSIHGLFSQQEIVNTAVYAPYMTERGEVMTVQVLLYKDSQYADAAEKAKQIDPDAEEKNSQVIGLPLKKGDVISAHLSFFYPNVDKEYINIEESNKQVTWNSNVEDMVFSVFIDKRYNRKLLNGRIVIKIKNVPVSEMTFCVKIAEGKSITTAMADINTTILDKVFISYSHADIEKVQYISETCKAIKCDYFFDRHSLDPGDVYPEKIFKYIDNANLFILCWSENAASSEWVEKERKRALDNLARHNQSLHLYPISIPPKTELPDDMKEIYSFGELSS